MKHESEATASGGQGEAIVKDADLPESEFELGFEEIARSKTKVTEGRNKVPAGEVFLVRPWEDYTLVALKDKPSLAIYDEHGAMIENFKENGLLHKGDTNWASLIRSCGGGSYLLDSLGAQGSRDTLAFDQLETFLKWPLREYNIRFSTSLSDIQRALGSDQSVEKGWKYQSFDNGKYLLCIDPETKIFFGYITENDRGIRLAPKDWKKIDFTAKSNTLPKDFVAHIEKTLQQTDDFKELNAKYGAIITDIGINIIDSANPSGAPVFKDLVPSVASNITVDPSNPDTVYYCQSGNPREITRLDMTGDPTKWQTRSAAIPKQYGAIKNLQLDPTGSYFLLYTQTALVMLAKETLEEIKEVPGLKEANFDSQGRVRAVARTVIW